MWLLERVPGSQLLLWTGAGEHPASLRMVSAVDAALGAANMTGRFSFDARVVDGFGPEVGTWVFDVFFDLVARVV